MNATDAWVLLVTPGPIEAKLIVGKLESVGLDVRSESDSVYLDTRISPMLGVRVYVRQSDVERAHAVLEVPLTGELTGQVCPVHERPALGSCSQCGSFLCQDCDRQGSPPRCEDCAAPPVPSPSKVARSWLNQGTAMLLVTLVVMGFTAMVLMTARHLFASFGR